MVDLQPALVGADRRRAGPDAANVPAFAAAEQRLVVAPEQEVRRAGNPHFRLGKGRGGIGPVQGVEFTVDLPGKEHDVFVFRTENDSVPDESFKISRADQSRGRAVTRDRHISNVKVFANASDAWVLDAVFLV